MRENKREREVAVRTEQETTRLPAIAGSELLAGEHGTRAYGQRFDAGKTRERSGYHGELTKGFKSVGGKAEMASSSTGRTESSCRRSAASRE